MIGNYWQVYAVCVAAALAVLGLGWCCGLAYGREICHARHARHVHRADPAPLPELPAADTVIIDARHANAMARTAPRSVPPVVLAAARLAALRLILASLATAAAILSRWAQDEHGGRPWADATGSFTWSYDELAALEAGPAKDRAA